MKKKNAYILGGSTLVGVGLYLFGKGSLTKKLQQAINAGDIETAKAIVNKTQKKKSFINTSSHIPDDYKIVELNGEIIAVPVAQDDYYIQNLENYKQVILNGQTVYVPVAPEGYAEENIEGTVYNPSIFSAVKEALGTVFGKIAGR